jgi:hypothetical protein
MRKLMLTVWPVVVAGCSANMPRGPLTPIEVNPPAAAVGQPTSLVGQPFVDFRFVGRNGKVGDFRHELGDYTVLAFLSGHADADRVALSELQTVLDDSATDDNVDVVGVVVGAPRTTLEVSGPLAAAWFIADQGSLHRAYGAAGQDWLYVIGPQHRIVMAAPASRESELVDRLEAAINRLSDERVAAAFEYGDDVSP